MEYIRITSINDPHFAQMHRLMQAIFPAEEVLEAPLWAEPLQDENLRVCVAVHEGRVVGATEYRYLPQLHVAMADFTIIGESGLGIGPYLWRQREADLRQLVAGRDLIGTFAEIYDPGKAAALEFGQFPLMHPVVRREVLSHLGFRRLAIEYVHPSWLNDGAAVAHLDLGFRPEHEQMTTLPSRLVVDFLTAYYAVLPQKPREWHQMVERLRSIDSIPLGPL